MPTETPRQKKKRVSLQTAVTAWVWGRDVRICFCVCLFGASILKATISDLMNANDWQGRNNREGKKQREKERKC